MQASVVAASIKLRQRAIVPPQTAAWAQNSSMRQSDDSVVAGESFALEDLADALERSLGGGA